MSSVAFSTKALDNPGGIRFKLVTVTPSSSYPTGGEPVVASDVGLASIISAVPAVDTSGRVWLYSAGKILAYRSAAISVAGGAAAAGTDALSVKANVLNKESVGAATVAGQAGLAEVTSTTDLSATTFTMLFIGS